MTKQTSASSYHHGNLRETLIEVGIELLEEKNVHALSLRQLAKQANVSHAAPYRHFADKEALLTAIAEQGFHALAEEMKTAVDAHPHNPRQQFIDLGRQYVSFGTRHPAQLTLMFSDLLSRGEDEALSQAAGDTLEVVIQLVEAAQAAGVMHAGDSHQIAISAWAMVHGLAMLVKEGLLEAEPDAHTENIVTTSLEQLLNGLESKLS